MLAVFIAAFLLVPRATAGGFPPEIKTFQGWWLDLKAGSDLIVVSGGKLNFRAGQTLGIVEDGKVKSIGLGLLGNRGFLNQLEIAKYGFGGIILKKSDLNSMRMPTPGAIYFLMVSCLWVPRGKTQSSVFESFHSSFSESFKTLVRHARRAADMITRIEKVSGSTIGKKAIEYQEIRYKLKLKTWSEWKEVWRTRYYLCGNRVIFLACPYWGEGKSPFRKGGIWPKAMGALRLKPGKPPASRPMLSRLLQSQVFGVVLGILSSMVLFVLVEIRLKSGMRWGENK